MAWAVADYGPEHRKAQLLVRRMGFNAVCAISDASSGQSGCVLNSGLTFLAVRSDGQYSVLADADVRRLLQELAARL